MPGELPLNRIRYELDVIRVRVHSLHAFAAAFIDHYNPQLYIEQSKDSLKDTLVCRLLSFTKFSVLIRL